MVTFSHPWALLLALPALWLLWISRRRSVDTHVVANLFLWMDAPLSTAAARADRRAAPPWLTWLQAIVLAFIAIAIAAPSLGGSRPDASLIVDLSTSMSARDGSGSRLDLAKRAAADWLRAQPARALIRVIGAGPEPRPAEVVRAGSAAAAAAVDQLDIQPGPDDLPRAIAFARRETTAVTVISDRPAPADASASSIEWKQVGAPADNVAITTFAGTRDGAAILEISNFGASSSTIDAVVTGGASSWHEHLNIAPFGTRSFLLAPEANRTLTASLRVSVSGDGNAISADDRRIAEVRTTKPRVALAGGDVAINSAINSAIGAMDDIDFDPARAPSAADVVVATSGTTTAAVPSLIFTTGGPVPVITRHDVNGVRRIDVSVDLANTGWTLTPAFPLFMADAIDWLTGRPASTLSAADQASIDESDTRHANAPRLGDVAPSQAPPPSRALWLVVALIALAGVLVDLALRRRALHVRAIAAVAVVAALIGVPLPIGGDGRAAAIALDVSASAAGNQRKARERVRLESTSAGGNDRIVTVPFGGADTDIAAGLRTARAALPPTGDRRVLLISDGQQTAGDAASEAQSAGIASVPIDVVPVDSRVPAYIASADAPMFARAGAPVPLRISVKGSPSELVRLTVTVDGRELDSRRVVLDDAGEARTEVIDRPTRPGVTFYRVTLADDRLGLPLSESGASTTVAGNGKLLVISDNPAPVLPFGSSSLDVVIKRPETCPDTRDGLASFSALVIDAVPPHRLSTRQLNAVASAVSLDGMGLLFLGSRDSLEASEFPAGPFADALPIDFTVLPKPPATSTALALLVDISGSMAATSDGVTKISAARDAITRALAIIPSSDSVDVLGFAAQPVELIGPTDPRDSATVAKKLEAIAPSGSTAIAPAVAAATAWLSRASSPRRRLLLVTDGKTSVSDAQATRALVAGQSIEVSVVAIGRDAERDWLTELAASTGGRAYFPDRLTDLAREVAREAARGAAGREVNETFVIRAGSHALAPAGPAPSLGGYIAGRLRDGATAAWKSQTDDAVLAAWSRGIGRVVVLASDVHGAWGAPLKSWKDNASFWRRATDWVARASDPSPIDAALGNGPAGPRLVVDLRARQPSNSVSRALPSVFATVVEPGGQAMTTPLHPVSPTRFEGPVALGETGDYRATISVIDPGTGMESRLSRGWYWAGDRESESRGANMPLLEAIAANSGGRVLPALGAPVTDSESVLTFARARRPVDGVPWLLFAALALLSFDYLRRAAHHEVP